MAKLRFSESNPEIVMLNSVRFFFDRQNFGTIKFVPL